ncbi:MAG: ComF family protein [Lysobacteraceae bacterium]|nr:ComF family protein [Xanthomonadaceae bacterium]HRX99066.1 ComF family protein [Xanthomonadaceae bacterium]
MSTSEPDENASTPASSGVWRRRARRWLGGLGRLILPARCLLCGQPGHAGRDLCQACHNDLPFNHSACAHCGIPLPTPAEACGTCLKRPPAFDATRAVFRYGTPVDSLLMRLKFHHDLAAGRVLGELFADELAAHSGGVDALLPVPLHSRRLGERGYNQSLELARPLARSCGLPLLRTGLQRHNATAPQTGLDRKARLQNLHGAFSWVGDKPPPARIALIDDTMTTGSTVGECARVLKRAGAEQVLVWVVARVAAPGR